MTPPRWAMLERQLLADNVPACHEFFNKYFDDRGYLQCFVRWGANDGPDDAFENFNRWPELHALGASDEILRMYSKGHEGLLKQYTEARTTDVPIARQGMYHKEFIVQSDWMHHGEGLQLFNRMGLSMPTDATYQQRARRFAGLLHGRRSRARPTTIRVAQDHPQHAERQPRADAAKGHGARLGRRSVRRQGIRRRARRIVVRAVPRPLPGIHRCRRRSLPEPGGDDAADQRVSARGEPKYKTWIVDYMDAWLDRMQQNGGIIPSFVDLDGTIGGPEGKWWGNAYGWGFSPVNPVTGAREDRNRIQWALPGFNNALLVTGDQKYVDAWRTHDRCGELRTRERASDGRTAVSDDARRDGWYGWRSTPWNVGALEVWYWSQKPEDLERVSAQPAGSTSCAGKNPQYPEQALQRDLEGMRQRLNAMRRDTTPPEKRLADNMLDYNPAATESLVQLMWGALMPGRSGGLLNARLRYFDPDRKRAGVPEDVAALVSELTDTRTTVTLINLNAIAAPNRHRPGRRLRRAPVVSVTAEAPRHRSIRRCSPCIWIRCGQTLVLSMKRYAATPTAATPGIALIPIPDP